MNGPDIRSGTITAQHQVWLYELPDDLLERHSVAAEHPHVVTGLFEKLVAHRMLQPDNGVPPYNVGAKGFTPWKDWRIPPSNN